MVQTFAFSDEIAMFIPHHKEFQPRVMQAIMQILNEDPLNARADRSAFIIVCPDKHYIDKLQRYCEEFNPGWIPVTIHEGQLLDQKADGWSLRNIIAQQIFVQDLFNRTLPLKSDFGFFGRNQATMDLVAIVERGENHALFGLRKTGKTSMLFRLSRLLKDKKRDTFLLHYDCTLASIRKLGAERLLHKVATDILDVLGSKERSALNSDGFSSFEKVIANLGTKKRICLVFDEVEFISFSAKLDSHWKTDFFDFWQTLRAVQQEHGKVSLMLAGLNASVVETDKVDGIQNPLFGIVPDPAPILPSFITRVRSGFGPVRPGL